MGAARPQLGGRVRLPAGLDLTGAWCWEARDAAGHVQVVDRVPDVWWADSAESVAEFALATLMVEVAPAYQLLAGWWVSARRRDESAVALADDWLAVLARADPIGGATAHAA